MTPAPSTPRPAPERREEAPERIWIPDPDEQGWVPAVWDRSTASGDYRHEYVRADLARPSPAAGWGVRPLEWIRYMDGSYRADIFGWDSKGAYHIKPVGVDGGERDHFALVFPAGHEGRLTDLQAIAQDDFAARILSALAPSPGTREAGLERATALIFETMCQLAQDYDIPRETVWNDPDAMDAARETARAALRALAAPDEEGRPTPATPTGERDHGE